MYLGGGGAWHKCEKKQFDVFTQSEDFKLLKCFKGRSRALLIEAKQYGTEFLVKLWEGNASQVNLSVDIQKSSSYCVCNQILGLFMEVKK